MEEEDYDQENDWWSDGRWQEHIKVEQTFRGPNILIPAEEKQRLNRKWNRSLIVKLLGRSVREDYLLVKLQQI